jgi:hypothetical protein
MPILEKANVRPETALLYLGRKPDATEKEMVKLPTTATPKRNIRMFFITRLSIRSMPVRSMKPAIKLKSSIFFSAKYLIR